MEDLGSSYKTYVDNEMISPRAPKEIKPNTVLRFGPIQTLFVTDIDEQGRPMRPAQFKIAVRQLTDLVPLQLAFERLAELTRDLRAEGHAIERLDLGGGLGIRYHDETPPSPEAYAAMVKRATAGLDCRLLLEPGRMMVGNAGVMVTKALYIKHSGKRRFVIVDAAMNDLLRPAMYDAYHAIEPVIAPAEGDAATPADIVGPICESGDTFAKDRPLPTIVEGDLLAIRTAGAYGAIMASSYNMRPLIPEVLVKGGRFAVIRRRPDFDEMTALQCLPDWLADSRPAKRGAA